MGVQMLKVEDTNGAHIGTIYATDGGTVSMRFGHVSIGFPRADLWELWRQLGNALTYAESAASIKEGAQS